MSCLTFRSLNLLEFIFVYGMKECSFFKKSNFIYLFLAALGLRCCTWAFCSCGERGLLFIVVCELLIAVASLCCGAWALGAQASVAVAHGLSNCGWWALEHRLSSCGAWA